MSSDPSVRLRALESSDLAFTRRWRNDPSVSDLALGRPLPATDADEEAWFTSLGKARWPSRVSWLAVTAADERVGLTMLRDIDWVARRADFGVWVSPDHQGKGFGRTVTELTLDEARRRLGLRKVSLHVRSDHDVARAMYSALGFDEEGLLREEVFVDGSLRDVVVMAIRWPGG